MSEADVAMKPSKYHSTLGSVFHWGFRQRLPLEHETALFILVNVLDFATTYYMLMHRDSGDVSFFESNPVARYFLNHWGVRVVVVVQDGGCRFRLCDCTDRGHTQGHDARLLLVGGDDCRVRGRGLQLAIVSASRIAS